MERQLIVQWDMGEMDQIRYTHNENNGLVWN